MAAQEPFFETSGGLLNASFQLAGCAKSDMFLSNVVHCHPRGHRKSHAHEIVNCSAYLHRESELVRPRLIIGLGGDAERVLSFFYPTARRVNLLFEAPGNVRSKAVPCLLFASHPCRVKRQHSEALEDEDSLGYELLGRRCTAFGVQTRSSRALPFWLSPRSAESC